MTIVVEVQRGIGWGIDWFTITKGVRFGAIGIHWAKVDGYELARAIVRSKERVQEVSA